MKRGRDQITLSGLVVGLFALVAAGCATPREAPRADRPVLRMGVSNAPQLATERGVQQFVLNITNEGLLRVNQEGRVEPWFAESWTRSDDGLRLSIRLRKQTAMFHDGSAADAVAIAAILNEQRTKSLKQWAGDVDSIAASGPSEIVITFKQPSAFFIDALMDVSIAKPGTPTIGIGAFRPAAGSTPGGPQIVAHDQYYLGAPTLGGLAVKTYPNIRAAWADMLRNDLDMLYEVSTDAIESMRGASNVSLYTFDRPYQYVMFLNPRSQKLKSPQVRQALNEAVDRDALIREALSGHGTPSVGPVSTKHWAYQSGGGVFTYAPRDAVAKLPKGLTLSCVTLAGSPFEQLALVVKRQMSSVGVELAIHEAPLEEINSKLGGDEVDAVILDAISGWGLSRVDQRWHSAGSSNAAKFSNPSLDAALDRINHAITDQVYRTAVADFQKEMANDPPAVFLAWSNRSRALSARFDVKQEPGRDILSTLRNWRRAADNRNASHH